jgi:hypothetical protein
MATRELGRGVRGAGSGGGLGAWRLFVLIAACVLNASCASVAREDVGSWREAVVAAREQSQVTFRAVNEMVRASQMERAATLTTLTESDFTPGLPADGVQRWNAALDSLICYAGAVEQLLAPELPQGVEDSLRQTGQQLSATADLPFLAKDTMLSGAIGAIGKKLVAGAANARARDIMLATDGSVKDLTEAMAAILYYSFPAKNADGTPVLDEDTNEPITREAGIAVTVRTTWNNRLGKTEGEFADASGSRPDIARRYAEEVAARQASLEAIEALRQTLIDLGPAHTAAAQGRTTELKAVIAAAREQVKVVVAVLAELKAARTAD